jgi:lipopolysaccharide export system protein LptA
MSARTTATVKFARRGIVVLLAVLLAAVVFRLAFRRPRSAVTAPDKTPPVSRTIDHKEGIRHREYKDGKIWDDVRADRFFLDEDGLNHLEGEVEIIDYGRAEGRETKITADRVVYDAGMVHFKLSGRVRIVSEDLTFETGSADYDKMTALYSAEQGGTFTSGRLAGSGRTVVYDEKANEVRLSGGFELDTGSGPSFGGRARLGGDSLVYGRSGKTGRIEGRARVSSAEGEGTAEVARFELTADEKFLQSVTFEKNAECSLAGEGKGRRVIQAGTIRLVSFPGSSRISAAEAQGKCRMSLAGPPGPEGHIEAESLKLAFGREGESGDWTASGGVRMNLEGKPGENRDIAGETVDYSGKSGLLAVRAEKARPARLESADSRIEAPAIGLETGPGNVTASDGVECVMKPRPDGKAVGFFSKDEALFAAGRSLASSGEERRLRFSGKVRLWQGSGALQADELEVFETTGEVRGRGGVTAGFPFRSKDAPAERRLEIGGEEMTFSQTDRTASFRRACRVRTPDVLLEADRVDVHLVEGKKDVQSLDAGGSVVLTFGSYEGRGGEARYDPAADTMVLTENPVLVEKGKGASGGDKLTFRLGDGNILIENKGEGRSITVVKS